MSSLLQMLASIFRLLTLESFGPRDLCCPEVKTQLHFYFICMYMYFIFKKMCISAYMYVCMYVFQLKTHQYLLSFPFASSIKSSGDNYTEIPTTMKVTVIIFITTVVVQNYSFNWVYVCTNIYVCIFITW